MNKKTILTAFIYIASVKSLFAQDSTKGSTKPFLISGFVDMYYRTDFGQNAANNRTSFTNSHNVFELGMASLKLEHSIGKVGFVADLGLGKRAQEFSYNDAGIAQAIKQLYVTYAATDWLKFTAGSWGTHVGSEVVDPIVNRNYSMSYMFSWGPFLHTGVKAEIANGKSGFMLGLANKTDYKSVPGENQKYLIAQYSYAPTDDVKIYFNYVGGKRISDSAKSRQFDVVITGKISNKFNIAYNGTVNNTFTQAKNKYATSALTWWGSAVYLNYDPSDKVGITLRTEYFSDKKQLVAMSLAPYGATILANTLSLNLKAGPLTFVPEIRFESASKNVFVTKNGTSSSNGSALVAAIYKF
jgi:hypothetical protein